MAKTRDLGRKRDKEQIFTCSSSNSSTSCEVTLSFQTWDLCHQVTLMGQAGTHSSQHQACGRGKIKFPVSPLDKESAIWLFASQEIPAERWIHIAESQRFGWDPLGKKKFRMERTRWFNLGCRKGEWDRGDWAASKGDDQFEFPQKWCWCLCCFSPCFFFN